MTQGRAEGGGGGGAGSKTLRVIVTLKTSKSEGHSKKTRTLKIEQGKVLGGENLNNAIALTKKGGKEREKGKREGFS